MNKVKWIFALLVVIVIAVFLFYHKQSSRNVEPLDDTSIKIEVKKKFTQDGSLKSDVEIVDGARNGVAHNYYTNGQVHSEIHYKQDLKHGTSTWFFQNGKPYRITQYVDGRKDGEQTKFYESGKLMSKVYYRQDLLQEGTVEYWEMGDEVIKYPQLNQEYHQGYFQVWLEPKVKKAKFYVLVKSSNGEVKLQPKMDGNKARFNLKEYRSKEATAYAEFKTKLGSLMLIKIKLQ